MTIHYYLVRTDDPNISMTWIGGPLIASPRPGHVQLTKPNGEPVLEARADRVVSITRADLEAILKTEAQTRRATLN